jgi:hypothetical protein
MYQKITQEKTDECCNMAKEEKSSCFLNPRKETLAFIMQFAYTYHVERDLPFRMSGMMLN